ncbi:MAG: hypothetical protein BGO14_03255 [Chlamydiales bacterium 38-26]|nr:leucine-rich repeat domain-containing protein [Chlamydiales bacterium]OJV09356.1 MAG: hypothetical protein BGO14_03255 [Chlamydiales bacterium 38-26]
MGLSLQSPRFHPSHTKAAKSSDQELHYSNIPISREIWQEICSQPQLTKLSLISCQITTIPNEIQNLKSLEVLDLSKSDVKFISENLYNLPLKVLNLSSTRVMSLSSKVSQLRTLEDLNVSDTPLKELPKEIYDLKSLKSLNLSGLSVDLKAKHFNNLSSLSTLNLSKTQVSKLHRLSLDNLKLLDVSRTPVSSLPAKLPSDCTLNIAGCSINRSRLKSLKEKIKVIDY